MKVIVDIDDTHYEEFMELLKTLNYVRASDAYDIPEWQQNIVRERIEKIERGEMNLIEVDDVMKRVFGDKPSGN